MAAKNEFNPFGPIDYSFQLLCAGIEIKQPQFALGDETLQMSVEMNPDPMNIDAFCDSEVHLKEIDPDLLKQERLPQILENIQKL